MKRAICIPLLLSACIPALSGTRAGPHALSCALAATTGLGYEILSEPPQGEIGSFTAERSLPSTGVYPQTAEIRVSVWSDARGGSRIQVEGDRYEERTSVRTSPTDGPAAPTLGGGSSRGQIRLGSLRRGRTRLSPGPVAEDVQIIEARCAGGETR